MEPNRVVKALKVLQDEGREHLIKEGVLEEAWVGLRRPKRLSAEGVSAAVAACSSALKAYKKFKTKSAAGRKVSRSPELVEVLDDSSLAPQSVAGMRGRRGVSLPWRQGSSLLQRVSAGGRGAGLMPTVTGGGRMGARARGAHARLVTRAQTRSPLERGEEPKMSEVEERPLGGVSNMAAPTNFSRMMSASAKSEVGTPVKRVAPGPKVIEEVVVISDEEEDLQASTEGGLVKDSRGRAYVSLDLWQPDSGEGTSGCDTSHASSGHGVQVSHWRSGRMVGDQSLPVKVRAPSEDWPEGRVRPGAVYPTSGETAGADDAQPSTSQGAGVGWASMDEELLDYEEDMEEPVTSQKWVVMAGDVPGVVQGGHTKAHRQDVSTGNLPRGEDGFVGSLRVHELQENFGGLSRTRALNVIGGSRELRMGKVDASIQGFSVLTHENIVVSDVELFRQDGVHLSFLGNELYLLELRLLIAELLGERLWDR
ncbi:hypothetical protein NDU88_003759 [Pleurodeles waltl]|uniref:Uncharacterized protein n=1 Tax=Pleurodeles waltl TaxID=8319 RepID=A0AAV7QAK7_PLEWA|nr:hypothetical protein NDU88_003759 [Pleurodeles waltl]